MVELVERMRYRSRMRGGFVVRYGSAHFRSRKHKNPLFACARGPLAPRVLLLQN
jgi:hypothetical protein